MKKWIVSGLAAAAVVLVPNVTRAQGISITPQIGVYVPGNSVDSLRSGAQQVRVKREGDLALGFNVDLGFLRGSVAYASNAKLNQQTTVSGAESQVGKGKLLAVAGDIVLRPLPRILVQPYLLAGAGLRRADYSYDTSGLSDAFPKDKSEFALHAGVGADLMLGPVGATAEITDFISKNSADQWKQHDGFGFVGLKLKF